MSMNEEIKRMVSESNMKIKETITLADVMIGLEILPKLIAPVEDIQTKHVYNEVFHDYMDDVKQELQSKLKAYKDVAGQAPLPIATDRNGNVVERDIHDIWEDYKEMTGYKEEAEKKGFINIPGMRSTVEALNDSWGALKTYFSSPVVIAESDE